MMPIKIQFELKFKLYEFDQKQQFTCPNYEIFAIFFQKLQIFAIFFKYLKFLQFCFKKFDFFRSFSKFEGIMRFPFDIQNLIYPLTSL